MRVQYDVGTDYLRQGQDIPACGGWWPGTVHQRYQNDHHQPCLTILFDDGAMEEFELPYAIEAIHATDDDHPHVLYTASGQVFLDANPMELAIGDLVFGNFRHQNNWFRGRIAYVGRHAKYPEQQVCNIAYDDGDFEVGIPYGKDVTTHVRLVEKGDDRLDWLLGLSVQLTAKRPVGTIVDVLPETKELVVEEPSSVSRGTTKPVRTTHAYSKVVDAIFWSVEKQVDPARLVRFPMYRRGGGGSSRKNTSVKSRKKAPATPTKSLGLPAVNLNNANTPAAAVRKACEQPVVIDLTGTVQNEKMNAHKTPSARKMSRDTKEKEEDDDTDWLAEADNDQEAAARDAIAASVVPAPRRSLKKKDEDFIMTDDESVPQNEQERETENADTPVVVVDHTEIVHKQMTGHKTPCAQKKSQDTTEDDGDDGDWLAESDDDKEAAAMDAIAASVPAPRRPMRAARKKIVSLKEKDEDEDFIMTDDEQEQETENDGSAAPSMEPSLDDDDDDDDFNDGWDKKKTRKSQTTSRKRALSDKIETAAASARLPKKVVVHSAQASCAAASANADSLQNAWNVTSAVTAAAPKKSTLKDTKDKKRVRDQSGQMGGGNRRKKQAATKNSDTDLARRYATAIYETCDSVVEDLKVRESIFATASFPCRDFNFAQSTTLSALLNSSTPQLAIQFLKLMSYFHNQSPNDGFCSMLIDLMRHGPKSGKISFPDCHRMDEAFRYVQMLLARPGMLDKFCANATSSSWVECLREMTQPFYTAEADECRKTADAIERIEQTVQVKSFCMRVFLALLQHQAAPVSRAQAKCFDKSLLNHIVNHRRGPKEALEYSIRALTSQWISYGHFIISDGSAIKPDEGNGPSLSHIAAVYEHSRHLLKSLGKICSYMAWIYGDCEHEKSDSVARLISNIVDSAIASSEFDPSPYLSSMPIETYWIKLKLSLVLDIDRHVFPGLQPVLATNLGVGFHYNLLFGQVP